MKRGSRFLRVLGAALLAGVPAAADADVQVHAILEPREAAVGQPVQLTLRVEQQGLSSVELQPSFTLDNLEVISGPLESRQVQIVNLSVSRTHTMTWQLVPQAPGPAAVQNIRVTVAGRVVQLADQTLTAIEGPPPSPPPAPAGGQEPTNSLEELMQRLPGSLWRGEPKSILRAEIAPATAWVGQQVLYTLHLYTQTRLRHSNWRHLPSFQDFWARSVPLPDPRRAEIVELDGERYTHAILLQWALFPLSPGPHEIGPAELELTAEVPERGLFGDLFREQQRIELQSRPVTVDIRELPPAPAGFGGTVGRYELRSTLDPREIRVGEAATLKLELRGRGNLQGLPDPRLASPAGLTVFPAASRGDETFDSTTVVGTRTWTFPVVAERSGRFALSPPSVVYFDPGRNEYATASVEPVALSVAPAPPRKIADEPSGPTPRPKRLDGRRDAMWVAAPAILLVALAALGVWMWRQRAATDAPFTTALGEAATAASPRHAASRLEAAWRDLLVRRHRMPAATPLDHWSERLAAAGIPARLTASLDALLADLRYLRQAPELATTDTLRADLVARSRRLAGRLTRTAR
ncbi:MAG: BatD family protein [Thermoanaerobaculia bacterium]